MTSFNYSHSIGVSQRSKTNRSLCGFNPAAHLLSVNVGHGGCLIHYLSRPPPIIPCKPLLPFIRKSTTKKESREKSRPRAGTRSCTPHSAFVIIWGLLSEWGVIFSRIAASLSFRSQQAGQRYVLCVVAVHRLLKSTDQLYVRVRQSLMSMYLCAYAALSVNCF